MLSVTEGERMGTCRGSKTSVVTGLSFVLLISLSSVSPQEGRPMGSTGELLLPVWRSRAEGGRGGLHGHENANLALRRTAVPSPTCPSACPRATHCTEALGQRLHGAGGPLL